MRFRSKPLAALSIILVLASALGGWHTPDDLDEYAAPALHERTHHDASVTTQGDPTAPEHCALCHWLQALGKAAPAPAQTFAGQSFQLIRTGADLERALTTARLSLSSRAPPLA